MAGLHGTLHRKRFNRRHVSKTPNYKVTRFIEERIKSPDGFIYQEKLADRDRDPEAAKRQRLKSRITLAPVKGYWP